MQHFISFFFKLKSNFFLLTTRYGLEGPGIESRWVEIFRTYPDQLRGPPSLLYNGYRVFPWGKGGRGVMLTTHPLLVPRLRKSWAIPLLTLWVLLGLLRGSLYLFFLLAECYFWWQAIFVTYNRDRAHTQGCNNNHALFVMLRIRTIKWRIFYSNKTACGLTPINFITTHSPK
jgi:hypothetical protein